MRGLFAPAARSIRRAAARPWRRTDRAYVDLGAVLDVDIVSDDKIKRMRTNRRQRVWRVIGAIAVAIQINRTCCIDRRPDWLHASSRSMILMHHDRGAEFLNYAL